MALTSTEKEMQCAVHWFQSWSEMQKDDFMKNLIKKAVPEKVVTLFDALESLDMSDKPPSIFKCQMKLFDDWFDGWTQKEQNDFLVQIEQVDAGFVFKFNDAVAKTSGQS